MGYACTARNILKSLKESWFGITQHDIQILIDFCPKCVGNTSRICAKQTPLKMMFSRTIGHCAQVYLVHMSSCETDDGFKRFVWYRNHSFGKCDVGATKERSAAETAPVEIWIWPLLTYLALEVNR